MSPRIVIAGGPQTGKSTFAKRLSEEYRLPVFPTDALVDTHEWSAESLEVSTWFARDGDWIVEGVTVPRALRKWFRNGGAVPCDRAIWLGDPHVERTPGQESMAKACYTVWLEVLPLLRVHGVDIVNL